MTEDSLRRDVERQALTAKAFVEMMEALVDDFDVIEVLTRLSYRTVELLDVTAAGILLVDASGGLRVAAASNERIEVLQVFQIQNEQGPCLDCYASGAVVANDRLHEQSPWPEFAAVSVAAGYPSVCAVPLRLQNIVFGCLNLFMASSRSLTVADIALTRALADVATIALAQDQATRDATVRERLLEQTLARRVVIEQAKGMIAERGNVEMDVAFGRLRSYARIMGLRLGDLADAIVDGTVNIAAVVGSLRPPPPPPKHSGSERRPGPRADPSPGPG